MRFEGIFILENPDPSMLTMPLQTSSSLLMIPEVPLMKSDACTLNMNRVPSIHSPGVE